MFMLNFYRFDRNKTVIQTGWINECRRWRLCWFCRIRTWNFSV